MRAETLRVGDMSETSVVALTPNEYQLQFYDAGCRAIEQARGVDEVKSIADKSTAVRAYARQVHNFKLEADAWVIRNRAYAKMGRLMGALRAEERLASDWIWHKRSIRERISLGTTDVPPRQPVRGR
jgi:hypothetical protein